MATLAVYAATFSASVQAAAAAVSAGVVSPAPLDELSFSSHDGFYSVAEVLDKQATQPEPSNLVPKYALPLRTKGRYVVDATGARVRLFCVNWYGAHLEQMVMNGLNRQPAASIAKSIVRFGFNCVRLPYSLDLVFGNLSRVPKPHESLAANPEWQDLSPLQVFDATVEALTSEGLMVILNNHVSSSGWCCSFSDGEGLWFTRKYSEQRWLDSLAFIAERYRPNPLVAGIDLRNEIRPSFLGSPAWGSGDSSKDWSRAAVQGAEAALQQDPDLLIVISGLYYGLFLCDVPKRPVHTLVESLRNRTVYTVHEYKWFNFHLVTRDLIGYSFLGLILWCSSLLLYYGVRLGVERYCKCCPRCTCCGCKQRRHARRRDNGSSASLFAEEAIADEADGRRCCREGAAGRFRQRCRSTWFIFFSALTLTGGSVVALCVSNNIVHICSTVMFVAAIVTWALALISGSCSVVLWGYLALRCMERLRQRQLARRESLGARSPAVSPRNASAADAPVSPPRAGKAHGSATVAGGALGTAASSRGRSSSSGSSFNGGTQGPHLSVSAPPEHSSSSMRDCSTVEDTVEACRTEVFEEVSSVEKVLRGRWVRRVLSFVKEAGIALASSRKVLPWTMAAVAVVAVADIWVSYGRFEVFAAELDSRWGFLVNSTDPAPVWLGEFGTIRPDDIWWNHVRRYIHDKELEWAYWSINGEKRANEIEVFGLLAADARTVANMDILKQVRELMTVKVDMNMSNSSEPSSLFSAGGLPSLDTAWFQEV